MRTPLPAEVEPDVGCLMEHTDLPAEAAAVLEAAAWRLDDRDRAAAARQLRLIGTVHEGLENLLHALAETGDRVGTIAAVLRRYPELLLDDAEVAIDQARRVLTSELGFAGTVLPAMLTLARQVVTTARMVGVDEWERAVRDGSTADRSPPDPLSEARRLLDLDRCEEALALLTVLARRARAAADYRQEGQSELLTCLAYQQLRGSGDEHTRLIARHAARAEVAFRRAGEPGKVANALTWQLGGAAAEHDRQAVSYLLVKLQAVDPDAAQWWDVYTGAVMSDDPTRWVEAFTWCHDHADLTGADAAHWRAYSAAKLDLISPRPGGTSRFEQILLRVTNGTAEPGELMAALDQVEEFRIQVRSTTKQRELSAYLEPFYQYAARLADDVGDVAAATDIVERGSNRSMLSMRTTMSLWSRSPQRHFDELRYSNEQLSALLGTGIDNDDPQLRYLMRQRVQLNHMVEERLVRLARLPHPRHAPVDAATLRGTLGPGDAVAVFTAHGTLYLLTASQVRPLAQYDAADVQDASLVYHRTSSRSGSTPELDAAISRLDAACVTPLRALPDTVTRLFIVPYGALWTVNLAVVGQPWLAESRTVSYVPSLTVLDLLLRRGLPVRRVRRFLGVADPDGTLPYAAQEVRDAAAGYTDPVVMIGDDIDFGAVLMHLTDVDVAHFACHGRHFTDFPDLSFLHVSGRGRQMNVLLSGDVIRIGASVRLLVLAACHAGTSAVLAGQEYVGLPGSFLIAGVNAVLAPLWAVDDRATAALMHHFYAALATAPSPAVALRHAQQAMLADPHTAEPRLWAGFLLIGVP